MTTHDQGTAPDGSRPRFSKLAGAALVLSPLLVVGCVAYLLYRLNVTWKPGWDGLGQGIALAIGAHVVLIGGSLTALASIVMALAARRKIRRQPDELHGLRSTRLAIIVSVTSLIGVWTAVWAFTAIRHLREAPQRAAESDIRAAYLASANHAQDHEIFPDKLEDVLPPEIAARYIYLAQGLTSNYLDHRTTNSQSIVVMHSKGSIDGKYTAVCANGMTHAWTDVVLRSALLESTRLRQGL